jgi:hypothetical protein
LAKEDRALVIAALRQRRSRHGSRSCSRARSTIVRPGGLGVHFIRELTDTMAYLPPRDTAWQNRLRLGKRIDTTGAAATSQGKEPA